MNYIILNNRPFFEDKININGLKEVDLDGSDRVDIIFGNISTEILENINNNEAGGDSVLPEQWLLRDGGVSVILFKIDRDILYSENTELVETMFGLFNKDRGYIEIWGSRQQESYNQLDQYLIWYNKLFEHQGLLLNNDIQEADSFQKLLKTVTEILL